MSKISLRLSPKGVLVAVTCIYLAGLVAIKYDRHVSATHFLVDQIQRLDRAREDLTRQFGKRASWVQARKADRQIQPIGPAMSETDWLRAALSTALPNMPFDIRTQEVPRLNAGQGIRAIKIRLLTSIDPLQLDEVLGQIGTIRPGILIESAILRRPDRGPQQLPPHLARAERIELAVSGVVLVEHVNEARP